MGRRACLGLDTATGRASVALVVAGEEPALLSLEERGGHARDLLVSIDRLMADAGLTPGDLRGIGVAVGPGSFTGVRVGLATAKGLAYALNIPIEGVSTLQALALAAVRVAPPETAHLAPVIPAGRGEVYSALFSVNGQLVERLTPDRAWRPEDLLPALPGDAVLVDAGALPGKSRQAGVAGRRSIDSPPLAATIACWAAARIPPGAAYRLGGLAPNYVRPSDAESARRRA